METSEGETVQIKRLNIVENTDDSGSAPDDLHSSTFLRACVMCVCTPLCVCVCFPTCVSDH